MWKLSCFILYAISFPCIRPTEKKNLTGWNVAINGYSIRTVIIVACLMVGWFSGPKWTDCYCLTLLIPKEFNVKAVKNRLKCVPRGDLCTNTYWKTN